jgi:hypothetical protein
MKPSYTEKQAFVAMHGPEKALLQINSNGEKRFLSAALLAT